jgi:putative PEP-CTERM system histidine kinase
MSAFVVHDLKNIVAQLSLMVKNAKRLQGNPEFQADMLMTVEHSLERMRQLMLQLRGDAPAGAPASPAGANLGQIAQRLVAAARGRGRQVRLDVLGPVFSRGQAERVERIIGHLVHNALDATDEGGKVWIKIERQASQACVEVGDSGVGMSAEFIETRLFKPFQSTKEAGMGIGTYESFQYVQELGGKILVDSQPGQGTVIRLLLPAMDLFSDAETTA